MIVLDTNVISEAMSSSPNPTVSQWPSDHPTSLLFTTTISLVEIFYGIELLPKGKRRSGLLLVAENMFPKLFAERVLNFDEAAASVFAPIAAHRRSTGRPITLFDAQIAAITRANGATLATRNTSDFEQCGVGVVNPWVE
jgi:predicted nucleic acid-binding protein